MLIAAEFALDSITEVSATPAVNLRRILPEAMRLEMPPVVRPDIVLDDWFPQGREHDHRLQQAVEALEAQAVVLDEMGEIRAMNRAWRMTADMHGLERTDADRGRNYLAVCRAAAAEGCRDAIAAAEGIDAVCSGRTRSFFYKYGWRHERELRYYLLRAARVVVDGLNYVVVSHELLEAHGVTRSA